MRKTLSVLLAIAMLFTMCMPVMATEASTTPSQGTYYIGVPTKNAVGNYEGSAQYYKYCMSPEVSVGDRYVEGDYEYKCLESNDELYWQVDVLDKTKTEYDEIYSVVNGVPVTSMRYTFKGCTNMVTAPVFTDDAGNEYVGAYDMTGAFYGCTSLKEIPAVINGSKMDRAFMNCTKLAGKIEIGGLVESMNYAFYNCKLIEQVDATVGMLEGAKYAFYGCKNLGSINISLNGENDFSANTIEGFIKHSGVTDIIADGINAEEIRELLLNTNNIDTVLNGGTYYTGVSLSNIVGNYEGALKIFESCAALPVAQRLDRFVYGDYEYICMKSGSEKYWQVRVLDRTKTTYGEILSYINNIPVKSLDYTFANCVNLEGGPMIPETVTSMRGTFLGCTSLTDVDFLPEGLLYMDRIFMGCEKLSMFPTTQPLPAGVTSMMYSFYNCKALDEIPAIPEGVDNLYYAFYNCKGLKSAEVEGNPTHYSKAFFRSGIERILGSTTMKAELLSTNGIVYNDAKSDMIVPEGGVYYVGVPTNKNIGDYTGYAAAYESGDMLPNIEQGDRLALGDYEYQYDGCTWHVRAIDKTKTSYGEIISRINGVDVTSMSGTFYNCTALEVAPAIPETVTTLDETFAGCISLVTAPAIESNITTMFDTFYGCTSLSGALEVNGVPSLYGNCLYGTQITEITGSTTKLTKTMLLLSVKGI